MAHFVGKQATRHIGRIAFLGAHCMERKMAHQGMCHKHGVSAKAFQHHLVRKRMKYCSVASGE